MPRTVNEYQQRWRDAITPGARRVAPWDEDLTPTSCIIYQSARSTPMGDGCTHFPDFGDAICFYRYLRLPGELHTKSAPSSASSDLTEMAPGLALLSASWNRYRSQFSAEDIQRRRDEGERALDMLLERFVEEGYQPAMGQQLIEIVNAALIDFELCDVFVLPGDLNALLARYGNPLADYDAYDDEEAAQAAAPAFDLKNPTHREALAEALAQIGL